MTKRIKIEYTLANGETITGGVTNVDRKVEDGCSVRLEGGSWMRIGAHSVFAGSTNVAVSANYYPDELLIKDCPDMRDTRIGQIAHLRDVMNQYPNHPYYAAVVVACNVELTHWDAHGETPKYYGG